MRGENDDGQNLREYAARRSFSPLTSCMSHYMSSGQSMKQCGGRKTERGAAACALARFAWRRVMSEVLLAAVWCDDEFLCYAATALLADREFILAAVQRNALCLGHASAELQADREVVLAAVKKDHNAVAFAAPELLEAERKLVMEAVHQDTTYHFGKYTPLRADVYVILHAVETSAKESKEYWRCHPEHDVDFPSKMWMLCVHFVGLSALIVTDVVGSFGKAITNVVGSFAKAFTNKA